MAGTRPLLLLAEPGDVGVAPPTKKAPYWVLFSLARVDKKDATLFMTGKPFYMALPYI